ncbi:ISL3 family transposase [Lentilactobacillus sp. Marseille-Q4993]|uniref:ISL3 family transposase n=1 Tax=Lentilactobacillus sp. Marseille-Q4993 TaxID=3039492 RepID=UPI0024BCF314|nr:ISL3 family transposase [Lentilactobacillus sp. Marseille-Q4993]
MSLNDCTRRTLGITDRNITFDQENLNYFTYIRGKKTLVYVGYLDYKIDRCPNCGRIETFKKNGTTTSVITLANHGDQPTAIKLTKQRYLCPNSSCHSSFISHSSIVKSNRFVSENTRSLVMKYATTDKSNKDIAALTGISASTVSRIISETSGTHYYKYNSELPENICIDEFRSVQKQMSFITCDAETHELLEILPGRKTNDIKSFFEGFDEPARKCVKTVTMDLNANYQRIIQRLFPNAQIIIDRFHVIQMLGKAIDNERLRALEKLDKSTREYKIIKTQWKVFKKSGEKLITSKRTYRLHNHEYLTDYEILEIGFSKSPRLKAVWEVYQSLLKTIHNNDKQGFYDCINNYKQTGTQMDDVMVTFKQNLAFIGNAVVYSYSNGPLEGLIRKIKQIRRTAYGYRNMKNLFTRIRLELRTK